MTTKTQARVKTSGPIKFYGSANEATAWGFTASSRDSSRRFLQTVRIAILPTKSSPKVTTNPLGVLAARLVGLDGVCPESLNLINLQTSAPYRLGDKVVLEWKEETPGRIERRVLSPLTIAALKAVQNATAGLAKCASEEASLTPSVEEVKPSIKLLDSLIAWLIQNGLYLDVRNSVSKLAEDQMCWWAEVLPGVLFSHCTTKLSLSALPRSCLARLETKLALEPDEFDPSSTDIGDPVTQHFVDLVCDVEGVQVNENLLATAIDILSQTHSSGVDGITKRLWASDIEVKILPLAARAANPQTVIILGWITYMCECGTISKTNVSVSTIRAYARRSVLALARSLVKFGSLQADPETWPPADLHQSYVDIIDAQSIGNRSVCSAALANFQHYLEEVYLTDALQDYLYRFSATYSPRVDAEVLWSHEIDWCIKMCALASDTRLGEIGAVMLAIARECPVRYQDLSRITMRNVTFGRDSVEPFCEIEIARDAYRGRLKTESAQRRLLIRNQLSIESIEKWLLKRRGEGATDTAYLFGDPADNDMRFRPVAVQAFLNRLVKAASGCPTMSFHNIRHSVISHKTSKILRSSLLVDVNPLEVLGASAGHASPITTLRSYSHLYEDSLRMWLDLGLRANLQIGSEDMVAVLTDAFNLDQPMLANTLVKTASRKRIPLQEYWWNQLDRCPLPSDLSNTSKPFSWIEPAFTPLSFKRAATTSIPAVADALLRLCNRSPITVVARIHGLQEAQIERMLSQLEAWLQDIYREHFPRLAKRKSSMSSLFNLLKEMRIDLKNMQSPTWSNFSCALESGMDQKTMTGAIEHWRRHGRSIYLPLTPKSSARPLIALLHKGSVARDCIRVAIQRPGPKIPMESEQVGREVSRLFEEEMQIGPYFEQTNWRRERPMAYLKINPHAEKKQTACKSEQSGVLKAWLISIKAHELLNTGTYTNE